MVMRALDWSHIMAQNRSPVTKIYIQICECHTDHIDISTVCVIYVHIACLWAYFYIRDSVSAFISWKTLEMLRLWEISSCASGNKTRYFQAKTLSFPNPFWGHYAQQGHNFKGPLCKKVDISVRFQASQILTIGDFRLCSPPCQGVELGTTV